MDASEFRQEGKNLVEWMSRFLNGGVEEYKVCGDVTPGFLRSNLPREAPDEPDSWADIMEDVHKKILPGVTHWQHSGFHAYFPYGASFPSLLGEVMADAIGSNAFSWSSNPAATELEHVVLDWLCRALGLPDHFLTGDGSGDGGGALVTSASEAIFNCMVAARTSALRQLRAAAERTGDTPQHDGQYLSRLVIYCSEESHSSIQKAAQLCLLRLRPLPTDDRCVLHGSTVRAAIEEDRAAGLIPTMLCVTLGTTSTASFDDLKTIGPVCAEENIWLHVDGAYAGSGLICPELRARARGLEYADSLNINPYKWLLTGSDCAVIWVRDKKAYCSGLIVEPLYLQAGNTDLSSDFRHWGVPLTRKFRALKLWFVLRRYGISGLQRYQRNHVALAKRFAELVRADPRFELMNDVCTGLVVFRLRCAELTRCLLAAVNAAHNIYLTPTSVKGGYLIRFCVNHEHATPQHMYRAWREICYWTAKISGESTPDLKSPLISWPDHIEETTGGAA